MTSDAIIYDELQLGYDASVSADACTDFGTAPSGFLLNDPDLALATEIRELPSGATPAPNGWYSDGTIARQITDNAGTLLVGSVDCQQVIACSEIANSGGVGVTEYQLALDAPLGGPIAIQFDAQGVPDKLEIIHNGIKVATSGMTVPNEGPFDNLYGDPTVPTSTQADNTDQFIGGSKGTIPTRESTFQTETGMPNTLDTNFQQWIWWVYDSNDYNTSSVVTVRITGISGTAWSIKRSCPA